MADRADTERAELGFLKTLPEGEIVTHTVTHTASRIDRAVSVREWVERMAADAGS
ncbi:hypothetical protein ACFQ61_34515 [Streptomyces sp. NPDC056500]|uniref:hypothetical protein n=1 Tax=Streptomyces sp. NPDC056500 TaxID=3345840 RepID=UPI0036934556